jgi:hypothetical protein
METLTDFHRHRHGCALHLRKPEVYLVVERIKPDGEQAGELIGPKVNGNLYQLDLHEWYPFHKAIRDEVEDQGTFE